ncbi:MAG TPA: glycine zipper domain-containing protein, partial [Bacteroidota bacterium]|nr:glycine zipper domain-containing protein [Bacteroidota bacterium]
ILEKQLGVSHHRVLFPTAPHQEAECVDVDGKPFLVRDLLRFDYQDHFEKYPGTGVITSEDFFSSEDALFAIDPSPASSRLAVLTGVGIARAITNDQAHAQVAEASPVHADSVSSAGDYPNPFLTLGLSTMREIRLLKRRHTDLRTAAKNIGLDVAGTGVGSFAGAKAGATIGTAVAPGVGSVVGAIIGGIGGAIAGRSITNKIKLAEAEAARAHYAKTMREFQERLEKVTAKAREAMEGVITKEQGALSQTGTKRLKELDALAKRLQEAYRGALILSAADIRKLFAKRDNDLRSQENQLEALRMRLTVWERTLWPSGQSVHLRRDRESVHAHRIEVFELGKAFLEASCPLSESEKTALCLELFASFGGYDQEIRNRISTYRSTLEESLRTLAAWPHAPVRELSERRAAGLRRIGERTETLRRQTGEQLKIDVKRAKRAQGRFARELRKLGLLP